MKTVQQTYFCETEEKKSRFLAFLMPFHTYDSEMAHLRQLHPKASHHVSAFRFFDTDKRLHEGAKDDGEPNGVAGMPTLKILQGHDLVNVALITVRYFGGTKLGTGGMARAYSAAAMAVIEEAKLDTFTHQATAKLCATFERTSDLERLLNKANILERTYTENGIELTITGPEEEVAELVHEWKRVNY